MPILQRDANNNTVSIKTLNDINPGDPLAVQIAQTLNATDSIVQTNIGGTNSAIAPAPTANTGLNGILKGLWQDAANRFLSLSSEQVKAPGSTPGAFF
jgi:hypothetical protein